MDPNSLRPARKVGIADHIWEAFEEMAHTMGSDRDALINQAMFMFARLNGFLETAEGTGKPNGAGARANGAQRPAAPAAVAARREEPSPRARMAEEKAAAKFDEDPARREVAERVLETAAELERLIKGKGENRVEDEELPDEAHELEDAGGLEAEPAEQEQELPEEEAGEERGLYLMAEGGEMDKISKDRFVIGRGKHCDFVINSGKVSREHAVILRDGAEFYIEDLGSSNGTWFNKQRIKRRKIEDGDEYYICSEKIKLVMR